MQIRKIRYEITKSSNSKTQFLINSVLRKIYRDLSEEIVVLKRSTLKAQILIQNKRQMAVPKGQHIENEEKAAAFSFHIYF